MNNLNTHNIVDSKHSRSNSARRVIVVGSGPVGIRFIADLKQKTTEPCNITLFGDEPYEPYDRIRLSQLLAGTVDYSDIFLNSSKLTSDDNTSIATKIIARRIVAIDPEQNTVTDALGESYHYDDLVLATGSSPHIPNIKNIEQTGVYTFRNIRDTESLITRVNRSRHVVVVGGGLLGIEAARGLQRHNTRVTLIHQSTRLMNRQLDQHCAENLEKQVQSQGISLVLNDGLGEVIGDIRVEGIRTRSGKKIDCDTVVLCTGVKPNTALAKNTTIAFSKGFLINEKLQTSQQNIYAIGECSQYHDEVYGLVAPGLEQASILAANFCGEDLQFTGTQPYTKLKVMNASVSSMGSVAELQPRPKQTIIHFKSNKQNHPITRSLALYKGRIIGACGVGDWPELNRVREAFRQERIIFPWQMLWFKLTGNCWFTEENTRCTQWPGTAVICQCNQLTKQTIEKTIANGANSVAAIGKSCGAGTVCGSCQPLLQELLPDKDSSATDVWSPTSQPITSKFLLGMSVVALVLVGLITFTPRIPSPDSVQQASLSWLWTDATAKQISGFSILGMTIFGLILSARKRLKMQFLGNFQHWRLVHAVLGVTALLTLFAHTGLSLGENLNRLLMINFLAAAAVGSALGFIIATNKQLVEGSGFRRFSFWMHLLTVWPLPVLLTAHVISSYYF